jgi:D-alanyl-D-alanine carboxypeptidase
MIPHRGGDPAGELPAGTFRSATPTLRAAKMTVMASRPWIRTARLLVLVLVATVMTGVAASVVSASPVPTCRVADITTAQRSYSAWDKTVLDTTYRLTSSYAPTDLRSTANAGLNSGFRVRALVVADLAAMARAARATGARFAVQSAYRSYATQRATFAYWTRVSGYRAALDSSARPGHSEHQLGTTLDLKSYGGSAPWNYRDWGTTRAGAWLRNNAWKYGFVLSYPKGKTSVTCYAYEPWHFRYVGRVTAARVHASFLTLRQYLWRQQTTPSPTPSPTPTPTPVVDPTPTPTPTLVDPTPIVDPTPATDPPSGDPSSDPSDAESTPAA